MSARPDPRDPPVGRLERDTLRLCVQILEKRAELGDRVVISRPFARVVARYLRRLIERGG